MGTQQDMLECKKCAKPTMHTRTTPNTILHIFLMFVTFGLWFLIWLLFIHKGSYKCTTCGNAKNSLEDFDKSIDKLEKKTYPLVKKLIIIAFVGLVIVFIVEGFGIFDDCNIKYLCRP